jgi:hypothetical protein
MTIQDLLLPPPAALGQASGSALASRVSALGTQVAGWLATAADYYTAATVYERLSGLSDAELQRRALSRATLASDICQACDRANP